MAALRVVLCGTGAASHTLAGVLASRDNVDLTIFTQNEWKAHAWAQMLGHEPLTVSIQEGDERRVAFTTGRFTVTSDPEEAGRGSDLVIVSLPAFLHRRYLRLLAPHLEEGCVVVGLPGQCGFEFDVRQVVGGVLRWFFLVNFDSLPWVCSVAEFGRGALITGTKEVLTGAMQDEPPAITRMADPLQTLQWLVGEETQLAVSGHLLGITLRSPNAAAHPPMMYSRWKDWDGLPLDSAPLFYEALDEHGTMVLTAVSEELLATAERIMAMCPGVDLSHVVPAYDWEIACYGSVIEDKTDLMSAVRTNPGYTGILHPMVQLSPEQFTPDFGHRFLAEDVPFGLAVLRGIAEIADVPTPMIDTVLAWSQGRLGKTYLTASGLTGPDVADTRCPQRYGFATLGDVLGRGGHGARSGWSRVPIA